MDLRTGVYAEGGLGRFDILPGDIQLYIWDTVEKERQRAATLIQAIFRRFETVLRRLPWKYYRGDVAMFRVRKSAHRALLRYNRQYGSR